MPNEKPAKYEYISDSFRILCGKARDLTRVSGSEFVSCTLWFVRECQNTPLYLNLFNKKLIFPVLHGNGEASCSVGEGVIVYSEGRQPVAHGAIISGNTTSKNSSIFEWTDLHKFVIDFISQTSPELWTIKEL
ncbi:hypothetical protein TNCV_811211 [Trichonephila clavipes]|uniref:Uncharacterized protein n=1 Tax=Trichonephila clavipes TaxID=2585209 RepID=A0A8X6SKK6_TRICX|nr:hypothetical protein TNCV_811211 [Trichonephila clavipes]